MAPSRLWAVAVIATLMLSACDSSTGVIAPRMQFTVQPAETQGSEVITPAVQVTIRSATGQVVRDLRGDVVLALGTNSSGGRLSGATRAEIVDGTATFSNLSIDLPGTYTLVATADRLASVTSSSFTIRLTFSTLSVGARHTCGTTIGRATYCWGANENGQIGNGDTTKAAALVPVPVSDESRTLHLAQVDASSSYACGLTAAGAAFCWGLNEYGSLGVGTSEGPRECSPGFSCSVVPLPVVGGLTFTMITTASLNCGLGPAGEAYCWGLNNVGQLVGAGVPHGTNSPTPVLMAGAPAFLTLAVGNGHGCGLDGDHNAWCWGNNASGSVGDSTFQYRSTPVRVAGGLTFNTLHAGELHTCGLTSAGAAYCWGSNGRGKVGNNTVVDQFAPVPVMGGLTFTTLSGGWEHTCGVTPSGAAYCWGENAYAQLGDGTTTHRHTPVPAAQGFVFTTIAAGRWHTCGLTPSGAVYCWGSNDNGELGNGTTAASPVPVRIIQ